MAGRVCPWPSCYRRKTSLAHSFRLGARLSLSLSLGLLSCSGSPLASAGSGHAGAGLVLVCEDHVLHQGRAAVRPVPPQGHGQSCPGSAAAASTSGGLQSGRVPGSASRQPGSPRPPRADARPGLGVASLLQEAILLGAWTSFLVRRTSAVGTGGWGARGPRVEFRRRVVEPHCLQVPTPLAGRPWRQPWCALGLSQHLAASWLNHDGWTLTCWA